VIALNQKVVDKFFKGVHRERGSSPGCLATASCKSSPLSSADFFFLPLFQPFSSFLSLTLSSFLPLLFSFTFYHFLPVSLFHPPFFLLTVSLSLSPSLPAFLTFLSPILSHYPSLSFVSFPLPSFYLTFSSLLPIFLSVSLFLTSFFPFYILLHSLIPSFSVPLSF